MTDDLRKELEKLKEAAKVSARDADLSCGQYCDALDHALRVESDASAAFQQALERLKQENKDLRDNMSSAQRIHMITGGRNVTLEIEALQRKVKDAESERNAHMHRAGIMAEQNGCLQRNLDAARDRIKMLEASVEAGVVAETVEKAVKESTQTSRDTWQHAAEEAEKERDQLRKIASRRDADNAQLNRRNLELSQSVQSLNTQVDQLLREKTDLVLSLELVNNEIGHLQAHKYGFHSHSGSHQQYIREINMLQSDRDQMAIKIATLEKANAELLRGFNAANGDVCRLTQMVNVKVAANTELTKQVERLRADIDTLGTSLDTANTTEFSLSKEVQDLIAERDSAVNQREQLWKELCELRVEREQLLKKQKESFPGDIPITKQNP